MKVAILPDEETIGAIAADRFQSVLTTKPSAVLGLATGSSPMSLYAELIARYQSGAISFANAQAFTLDEYVGLPDDHPERYRNVITTSLASRVDFGPGAVHSPDGNADDLEAAAAAYDHLIRESGGVDIQILGIGSDGHIAFNEPGGSLSSRTHIDILTAQTRADNARFFNDDIDAVPTRCLTQGLGTIMEARELVLVATGESKAQAVHEMVEGGVSALWPATIMQFHNNALVLLDEAAASELKLANYYREIWGK